jgi:hypothetical protein
MPPVVFGSLVLFAAGVSVAYWRGGEPERYAAAIISTLFVTDISYHLLFGPSGFDKVDPIHLVLDGAELIAMVWLALKANRMWPLWAAAAQLLCYTGHMSLLIQPHGMKRAYWAMTQLPPFIQIVALLLGVAAHARRQRRWGEYRSWRLA